MERTSEADYNEGTKKVRVWDREKPNATGMDIFDAATLGTAELLLRAKGWETVGDHWSYSALEGFNIKLRRA